MDHKRGDLPRPPGDHFRGDEGQSIALPDDERGEAGELPPRTGWAPLPGDDVAVGRWVRRRCGDLAAGGAAAAWLAAGLGLGRVRGRRGGAVMPPVHAEFDRRALAQRLDAGSSISRRKLARIQSRKKRFGTPMVRLPWSSRNRAPEPNHNANRSFPTLSASTARRLDTMSISSLVTSVHPGAWRPPRESAKAVLDSFDVSLDATDFSVASFAVKGGPSPAARDSLTGRKQRPNHRQIWRSQAAPPTKNSFFPRRPPACKTC